jgi:uncharacterized membrane-anchored protein
MREHVNASQVLTSKPGAVGAMANKVPEITAVFWITKVLTTGMGETTSDFLLTTFNRPISVGVTALIFVAALIMQFRSKAYVAWIYWFAVIMVSVFGTMVADIIHVLLGVPYEVSTSVFVIILAAIFIAWYATQKTLSIHTINTRAREWYYWAVVLMTFALGTAVGDLTAVSFDLGYLTSGFVFAGAIVIPALAYRFLHLNGTLAFWAAYVLTRPVGASFADWAAAPEYRSGIGLGTGPVSIALTVVILALVGYLFLAKTRRARDLD